MGRRHVSSGHGISEHLTVAVKGEILPDSQEHLLLIQCVCNPDRMPAQIPYAYFPPPPPPPTPLPRAGGGTQAYQECGKIATEPCQQVTDEDIWPSTIDHK